MRWRSAWPASRLALLRLGLLAALLMVHACKTGYERRKQQVLRERQAREAVSRQRWARSRAEEGGYRFQVSSGDAALRAGKAERALQHYAKAETIRPTPEVAVRIGDAHRARLVRFKSDSTVGFDYVEATRHYRRALKRDASVRGAWIGLAWCAIRTAEPQPHRALEYAEEEKKVDPSNPDISEIRQAAGQMIFLGELERFRAAKGARYFDMVPGNEIAARFEQFRGRFSSLNGMYMTGGPEWEDEGFTMTVFNEKYGLFRVLYPFEIPEGEWGWGGRYWEMVMQAEELYSGLNRLGSPVVMPVFRIVAVHHELGVECLSTMAEWFTCARVDSAGNR